MKHAFDPFDLLEDRRFRDLLGEAAWARTTPAIRRRFGKRLTDGSSVTYQGRVAAMRMSAAGWLLAHLARLAGSPLPFDRGSLGQAAVVVVTEDPRSDGQFWVRHYGRRSGFPQVVHSSKRFCGPTGLEEYIGYGIGMALVVEATEDALLFESTGYFLQAGPRRLPLPRWLTPGTLVVGHHDMGDGRFRFSLRLTHSRLGELIAQDCIFEDGKDDDR